MGSRGPHCHLMTLGGLPVAFYVREGRALETNKATWGNRGIGARHGASQSCVHVLESRRNERKEFTMKSFRLFSWLVTAMLAVSSLCASAILPGFGAQVGGLNDDGGYPCSSSSSGAGCAGTAVPIGFTVNYFGQLFSSLYVNTNGNLTFTGPLSTFTPFGLTTDTGTPIIAPFFADVDTRFAGNPVALGYGTVNGDLAFGATWTGVDYYFGSTQHTLSDTFQVVMIDRSDIAPGDFDIEFNYGQVQWETGDASGGSGGLGGSSARAGFSAGTGLPGSFYELPGSGVPGSFLDSDSAGGLVYGSLNSGVAGRYVFDVRNGAVTVTPEPGTAVTFVFGIVLAGCGMVRGRRHGVLGVGLR